MRRAFLITSGAYIGEEMQAEFGRLPPAFLPVGSRYMIQHQRALLPDDAQVWLSLPHDYDLDLAQRDWIAEQGIEVIRIDARVSLGMSVFQSLFGLPAMSGIEILHGDTLVAVPESLSSDSVSVSRASVQYRWGLAHVDEDRIIGLSDATGDTGLREDALILSGYFFIKDVPTFLQSLVKQDFRFVAALDSYAKSVDVRARRDVGTLDMGHLKTYYASRHELAVARHFNALRIDGYTVLKQSADAAKLAAEANWLRSIPASLQPFGARLVEDEADASSGYRTLYAHLPTAAELYLARPSRFVWNKLLASCCDYLERAASHVGDDPDDALRWLAVTKLRQRISDHPEAYPDPDLPLAINGTSVGTLAGLVDAVAATVEAAPRRPAQIMHGDFCFSNMLFDPRSDRIQLIDPRGSVDGRATIFGDLRYDIAKLGHSIVGRYDQIVGGQLRCRRDGPGRFSLDVPVDESKDWLEARYRSLSIDGVAFDDPLIDALMVSLFLSMVPLHSDDGDRQDTMLANALRLAAGNPAWSADRQEGNATR